jgi:hypothetical protein
MSKRSVLVLATIFGVIGISEAFGKCDKKACKCEPDEFGKCAFVHYDTGERRKLEVRDEPLKDSKVTPVDGVTKIEMKDSSGPGWCKVETIPTTTGGDTATGWILTQERVGKPARNCGRAFRVHR